MIYIYIKRKVYILLYIKIIMEIYNKELEKFEVIDNVIGMMTTSVQISPEFFKLCKENNIKFVEAMRTGISILLAEKGVRDYDNKLTIYRRLMILQEQMKKNNDLIADLEKKLGFYEGKA